MSRFHQPRPTDDPIRCRGRIVAALLGVGLLLVVGRLFQLQIVEHVSWSAQAAAIQERTIELPPRRGTIYDRGGEPLAVDVKAKAIAVDGIHASAAADALATILSQELGRPLHEMQELVCRDSYFTWIDRRVDLDIARRIERRTQESGAYGLILIDTWKRCYPQGSLASNLIGFVGTDGLGLEGAELAFDDHLRGRPQRLDLLQGADGRTYRVEVLDTGCEGKDLVLTIDSALQFLCEEEIRLGVSTYRADAGMIVVLDPHTGDVLAMAQDKTYDLNRFWTSTPDARRNIAVTEIFEPGSIFKVFAGLAALDAGAVSVTDTFDGTDGIELFGHVIHNADHLSYGTVTFAEIIADSINTGMIRVAQRLGEAALYGMLDRLGFGHRTGIGLPGEVPGILREIHAWSGLSLASTAIGQSVAVTGIQLARALAVVANGGVFVSPRVARREIDETPLPVVSRGACEAMRELMVAVVEHGTGRLAAVDGYSVAGKTGTAQKAVAGEGYVDGKYTSLFGGILPAENPQYVLLVVLDEVKRGPVSGGSTAAPIFRNAAERLARQERLIPVLAH